MTDAWEMHQAETGLNPGPVWRDRGVIIANLTLDKQALEERVAELELAALNLRDQYQGAHERERALLGERDTLTAREDIGYGVLIEDTGILLATYDGTAKKHTRRVWTTPWVEVPE